MSKAIYLSDPDGIGIEIALETPQRFGRFANEIGGFGLYDNTGCLRSGRDPLDMRVELAGIQTADLDAPLRDGAFVAHLHLHVPALDAALSWFETIGFSRNLYLPHMGFADMGAGGSYTHRLAVNIWAGRNVAQASPDSAGLHSYTLRINRPASAAQDLIDPVGARAIVMPQQN